ncbi:hypothetical protein ZOSMA_52G01080 [Zostera marina]|uniref:Uncharacterized protein n=1 Tax=Zostera marina TaxID=29655 RepID=A0A0K9NZN5_ZOSMR|nr:hypothetical protein ZOSMA_52G01080 [Zostera marina]
MDVRETPNSEIERADEIVEKIREILKTADLDTTTPAIVRKKLEDHFGISLSGRTQKNFVRNQIRFIIEEQEANKKADEEVVDEDDEEEEEGNEEETVKKRKPGGFTKICSLSPKLQNLLGESELARTQVVKRIWNYIHDNNLQDPKDKRNILCDDKLFDIFNVKTIGMFKMNKALSKHIWSLNAESAPPSEPDEMVMQSEEGKEGSSKSKKVKKVINKRKKEGNEIESSQNNKCQKLNNFQIPLILSSALVKFFGTDESMLSRSEVVKRMWAYIKKNDLQNPNDKRQILCDGNLIELFGVKEFHGFGVAKLLSPHLSKPGTVSNDLASLIGS